jgi:hypothetical protein
MTSILKNLVVCRILLLCHLCLAFPHLSCIAQDDSPILLSLALLSVCFFLGLICILSLLISDRSGENKVIVLVYFFSIFVGVSFL